jgi:SAM-dependent methyltransferase
MVNHRPEHDPRSTGVSDEVRDFYDRYPYPRPVDDLDRYRTLWQDPQRRRADHHLFWPARAYREDRSILIAGCGTSQAAKHAMRWPAARVIGIDFSATSVRATEELKHKYDLDNLEVRQLPVERARELETSFDQIVCTGVLHHLPDPEAGLAILRGLLDLDGALHLMVYAPYGRAGIYLMQEFCRRTDTRATDEGIRDLVASLGVLPLGHPLSNLLREAPDFRQEAELADALLNPQDRAYTVSQLFELIEGAGLAFGRWVRQAPYSHHCGVMARIPQASRIARLPAAEQYAAAELFRGSIVSHSVVVYRDDRRGDPQPISFADDAWLRHVPIRIPETISVQERLPPGAAAVLINRGHYPHSDIYLPIDATGMRQFDAIDGERTAGEIAAEHGHLDTARGLFEKLWWHDQIVFDASWGGAHSPSSAASAATTVLPVREGV